MTLNILNELILSNSSSSVDGLTKLRQNILERTDGIKIESSSVSDAFGTRLLEFCNHLLPANTFSAIVLLAIQADTISDANFYHLCNLTSRALDNIQPNQMAAARNDLYKVLRLVTSTTTTQHHIQFIISLLLKAIPAFQIHSSASTLTPVHTLFLRACISAKLYHLACIKLYTFNILEVDPTNTLLVPLDCLLYFYYAGISYIGMKRYEMALRYLSQAISYPGTAVSAVMIASIKKAKLISLIATGKPYEIPRYSYNEVKRLNKSSYNTDRSVYDKIVDAFMTPNSHNLHQVINAAADELRADKNLGLAKQVCDAIYDNEIRKVTTAYVKISIDKMSKLVTLPVDVLINRIIKMNGSGDIIATIDERSSMITFNRYGMEEAHHTMDSQDIQATVRETIADSMKLVEKFNSLRKSVLTSKAYIQKSLLTSAGQGAAATSVADDRNYEEMEEDL